MTNTERDAEIKEEPKDKATGTQETQYIFETLKNGNQRVITIFPDGHRETHLRHPSGLVIPEDYHGFGG